MNGLLTSFMMKMGQTKEDGALGFIRCITSNGLKSASFVGPGSNHMAFRGPEKVFPMDKICNEFSIQNLLWEKSCEAIGEYFRIV